jgi:hypothetical protein
MTRRTLSLADVLLAIVLSGSLPAVGAGQVLTETDRLIAGTRAVIGASTLGAGPLRVVGLNSGTGALAVVDGSGDVYSAGTVSGAVTASGAWGFTAAGTALSVTNNATVGGTLGVTGATTLASGGSAMTFGASGSTLVLAGGASGTRFQPFMKSSRTIAGMTEMGNLIFSDATATSAVSLDWYMDGTGAGRDTKFVLGVREDGTGRALILDGATGMLSWPRDATISGGATVGSGMLHAPMAGALFAQELAVDTNADPSSPYLDRRLTLYRDGSNWSYWAYGADAVPYLIIGSSSGVPFRMGYSSAADGTGTFTLGASITAGGAAQFNGTLDVRGAVSDGDSTLSLNDAVDVSGITTFSSTAQGSGWASRTTSWGITQPGDADFRGLFTDEFRARVFTVELSQAFNGSLIVTKSVAEVSQAFTCPSASGANPLWVRDFAATANIRVYQSGDSVLLRTMGWTDSGSDGAAEFALSDCIGVVTAYADGTGGNEGQQSWTFTRPATGGGSMTGGTVVAVKTQALDFGVTGDGYLEQTTIDGTNNVNAPYLGIATWATTPAAANRTARLRLGQLRGITSSDEYGVLAGTYAATNGSFFRASDQSFDLHNITLKLWDGATNTILLLPGSAPSLSIGSPVPTAYGTGVGFWVGDDGGTYKLRVGDPAANRLTWDGSTLTIVGNGSGLTSINGGNIQTNTVTTAQLVAGLQGIGDGNGNLAVNGGGERGTVGSQAYGWTAVVGGALQVATDNAKFGERSMKIVSGGGDNYSYQDYPVINGAIYELTFWIKVASQSGDGWGSLINVDAVTASVTPIESRGCTLRTGGEADIGIPFSTATQDWTLCYVRFKANATGTSRASAQLGYAATTTAGTVWFDGIEIRPVAAIYASDIVAGTITTTQLSATAIDGMTITGSTVRTAASGARVVMDTTPALKWYNSGGGLLGQIASGGMEITPYAGITEENGYTFNVSAGTTGVYGSEFGGTNNSISLRATHPTGESHASVCVGSTCVIGLMLNSNAAATFTGADFSFDAGTLYVDAANNRVGVGTSSPTDFTLDVAGGARFGSSPYATYVSPTNNNTINVNYGDNTDGHDLWVNYRGYNDGFTRTRDFLVGDGKGNALAQFNGANMNLVVGTGSSSGLTPPTIQAQHASAAYLSVKSGSNPELFLGSDSTAYGILGTLSNHDLGFRTNNTLRMTLNATGLGVGKAPGYQLELSTDSAGKPTSSTWTIVSDARTKKNVRPWTKGLAELAALTVIQYEHNGLGGTPLGAHGIGVVAQDAAPWLPESIRVSRRRLRPDDAEMTDLLAFDTHGVIWALVNAVQELATRVETLEARVTALEPRCQGPDCLLVVMPGGGWGIR